eukprot:6462925-Amphidinium_carterae.2
MPDEVKKEKDLVQRSLEKSRAASKDRHGGSSREQRSDKPEMRKKAVPIDHTFGLAKAKKLIPQTK